MYGNEGLRDFNGLCLVFAEFLRWTTFFPIFLQVSSKGDPLIQIKKKLDHVRQNSEVMLCPRLMRVR